MPLAANDWLEPKVPFFRAAANGSNEFFGVALVNMIDCF